MIDLSQDQKDVLNTLWQWYKDENKKPYITLGGYAGTGKTTLISIFRKHLHETKKKDKIAFCSYTGKATRVLRSKLVETGCIFPKDSISTIHGLIYSPIVNKDEEITGWEQKEELEYQLIIVDEASMVDERIWRDLLSYHIPIIAVGDHGQLPPISGAFNLVEKPMLKLEKIHRQAAENPIIKLSIDARTTGRIEYGKYGTNIKKLDKKDPETQEYVNEILSAYNKDTLVLCGYNFTRIKLNKFIRGALGFESEDPMVRDRVICLRNNHAKDIYNGMLGTIKEVSKEGTENYYAAIEMDDDESIFRGLISQEQFNNSESLNFTSKRKKSVSVDLFDFGYATTVHKAQGSQAKRVILFEERFSKMDEDMWKRWLYTAVTRAEEELIIIG
ncbi:MAG: ATP-dependent DNA helicase [Candidatus Dojkabacteria bacterium]